MSVPTRIFETRRAAEFEVAREIAALVAARRKAGAHAVLGLATGGTPTGVYAELIRLCAREGLDLDGVETFNLDEYHGVAADHPGSFHAFMRQHLFDHVNLRPGDTHLLDGAVRLEDVPAYAADYEGRIRAAGGIDLQLLGIGTNGHIGFNEPGSTRDSRTRRVVLAESTRTAYADSFDGAPPTHALTVGVATIIEARRLRLLAFGERKAEIVARFLRDPVSAEVPATFLRGHPDLELVLDAAAAEHIR